MSASVKYDDMFGTLMERLDNQEKDLMVCREELSQLRRWKIDATKQLADNNKVEISPSTNANLKLEIEKLHGKNDEFSRENANLKFEIEKLHGKNDEFGREIVKLLAENIELRKKDVKFTRQLRRHDKRVDDLQSVFNTVVMNTQHNIRQELDLDDLWTHFTLGTNTAQASATPSASTPLASATPSASTPTTSVSPPLQMNHSLQQTLDYFNKHNPEDQIRDDKDSCFEMFMNGHSPAWPTSCGSRWRLTRYNKVLVGDKLRESDFRFSGETGMVSCKGNYIEYDFDCWLEVRQTGSGFINWYLCTNKKPKEVKSGGPFKLKQSVDKGQIFSCHMVTTDQRNPTCHSNVVDCCYDGKASLWVEAWRTSGDAVVAECRFYG